MGTQRRDPRKEPMGIQGVGSGRVKLGRVEKKEKSFSFIEPSEAENFLPTVVPVRKKRMEAKLLQGAC